jgi:thioredoxin 1
MRLGCGPENAMAHEFTDANFEAEVLKSDKPVLVDFWAPWCGPCKMIGPLIEKLAKEMEGTVKIGKVNVDESSGTASQYGVMSIPTLMIFKGGKPVGTKMGFMPEPQLREFIKAHA